MSEAKAHYDIALSFCHEDLSVALAIGERLGDAFRIFVYAKRQDDVAGTDGLESFRDIFRNRCTLAVVLFRSKWGQTPWTRVELEAITDRFLKEGPQFLFFVNMDDSSPPPWMPEKLIRLSYSGFGVEQAVGAIRARALEAGAAPSPPTPEQLALRAKEAFEFGKHREYLLRSYEGAEQAKQESQRVLALVYERFRKSRDAAPELEMSIGIEPGFVGARVSVITFYVVYYNWSVNVVGEARLRMRELHGGAIVPGEQGRLHFWQRPVELAESDFHPQLLLGKGWCWRSDDGRTFTSEALADLAVSRLFALVHRAAAGELPPLGRF